MSADDSQWRGVTSRLPACLCVCFHCQHTLRLLRQGLDTVHKQRVAEVLSEPEAREKQRSRESLTSDTVKYESGPDGGEEVSMSVEWNGVSTVQSPPHATPVLRRPQLTPALVF